MRTNRVKSITAPRRGSILILVAVIFVAVCVLLGLVIDLGVSYIHTSRLQTAADAAAFAAATLLPIQTSTAEGAILKAQAEQMARDYVNKNGDEQDQVVSIEFEDIFTDDHEGPLYTSVRVRLQRSVEYLFGPIVGLNQVVTQRHAKVRVEAVIGSQKVAPLGISLERRNSTVAGESVAIPARSIA